MKRIGYLISQYPAPSHTFIRREIEALRRRGVAVDTFSLRRPDKSDRLGGPDRNEQAATWYLLPVPVGRLVSSHAWAFFRQPLRYFRTLGQSLDHRVPGLRALLWALFYFIEAMVLARELRRRGVAHLHSHFANSGGTVGMLAGYYLGVPWSLTLHGISEFDYPNGLLLGKKLAHAEFAACVTTFGMAQAMRGAHPQDWNKLALVRCGIDTRVLPASPEFRPARPSRVLCVARLAPEKGHLGLLEAFAQAKEKGLRAQLRLVGGGSERARIEEQIAALGLQEHCTLLGQLPEDETLREMADSDVLVSASFMEGLPVVLMEAMALGLPVVAPSVAGIPELVHDGSTGLLFAPADWSALADRLVRLLGDSDLRARLGRAGRERVLAEFNVDDACAPLYRRFTDADPGEDPRSRRSHAHLRALQGPKTHPPAKPGGESTEPGATG